jgi:hypothetical protein
MYYFSEKKMQESAGITRDVMQQNKAKQMHLQGFPPFPMPCSVNAAQKFKSGEMGVNVWFQDMS